MKTMMLTLSLLATLPSANAAYLHCQAVDRAGENGTYHPHFTLAAKIDDAFLNGGELKTLSEVEAQTSKREFRVETLEHDAAYAPRTNKNRVRFPLSLSASDNLFDGIIHGVLLPKTLTDADITETREESVVIKAQLLSSTDSYHDGIISYFPMTCEVSEE